MRITIDLEEGSPVHDPSVVYPVGRVVSIVDNTFAGQERKAVVVELDEKALRSRLRERRGAF